MRGGFHYRDFDEKVWLSKNGRAPSVAAAKHALLQRYPSAVRILCWKTDHTMRVLVYLGPIRLGQLPEVVNRRRRFKK